jgi:hypothetical protein
MSKGDKPGKGLKGNSAGDSESTTEQEDDNKIMLTDLLRKFRTYLKLKILDQNL